MAHIQRFDHIGITVADLDLVTTFFVGLDHHSGFMPNVKRIVVWPASCNPGVSALPLMPVARPGACRKMPTYSPVAGVSVCE